MQDCGVNYGNKPPPFGIPGVFPCLTAARAMLSTAPMTDTSLIRNFSIIAHIDHGKSTLSDRLIQLCGNVTDREMKEQILNSMDIERERGITIKAQTVRLDYKHKDGKTYQLNLMDTPGHVDFAYEVSRSLAACEGALLVVDASQGVEAQTLANVYQALDNNLEILPGPQQGRPAGRRRRPRQAADRGRDRPRRLRRRADLGQDRHRTSRPCWRRSSSACRRPRATRNAPLKALLIDSWYDAYLGVVVLVRVIDGALKKGQKVKLMATDDAYQVERVGIFRPKQEMLAELGPGEVGFFTAAIKQVADTRVGDTVTDEKNADGGRRCRASSRRSRWCSAACSRSMPPTSRTCARRWRGCASTTPASPTRRKARPRSASASAAASSACCTWRSSPSGSSASSTST